MTKLVKKNPRKSLFFLFKTTELCIVFGLQSERLNQKLSRKHRQSLLLCHFEGNLGFNGGENWIVNWRNWNCLGNFNEISYSNCPRRRRVLTKHTKNGIKVMSLKHNSTLSLSFIPYYKRSRRNSTAKTSSKLKKTNWIALEGPIKTSDFNADSKIYSNVISTSKWSIPNAHCL